MAYSHDHLPPHVHGRYAGVQVLVEMVDGTVKLARRPKAIRPQEREAVGCESYSRDGDEARRGSIGALEGDAWLSGF